MRGAECVSDHHLLVAERKIQQDVQRQQLKSWNIDSLQNDSTRFLNQFRLATKLSDMKDRSPEEIYESLKRKIHEATYKALGEKSHSNAKTYNPPWWTENLELLKQKEKKLTIDGFQQKHKKIERTTKKKDETQPMQ
ncbi:hypothetical protein HHI36_006900 [Cryptolaemus montrouzieri]|uniref:Uncharacterized protein n=1 Tax=Cryptolaemus montrouzieri TaxID=559131 RepID=A0ABD2MN81_9CUCU